MIRDGVIAEPVKSVVLVGFVTELLGAVDRVAGDFRWHEAGGGCGKAGQSPLPVSEGARTCGFTAPRSGDRRHDRPAARRRARPGAIGGRSGEDGRDAHVRLRDGEVVGAQTSEQAGHNLRVMVDGRIGVAGTTAPDAVALLEAALASAAAGEEAPLLLPGPSPLPGADPRSTGRCRQGGRTRPAGRLLTDRLRKGDRGITCISSDRLARCRWAIPGASIPSTR